jgi:hypothetical protein
MLLSLRNLGAYYMRRALLAVCLCAALGVALVSSCPAPGSPDSPTASANPPPAAHPCACEETHWRQRALNAERELALQRARRELLESACAPLH